MLQLQLSPTVESEDGEADRWAGNLQMPYGGPLRLQISCKDGTQVQELIRRPQVCHIYLNETTQTVSGDKWTDVNASVSSLLLSRGYEPAQLSSSVSREKRVTVG